MTEPFVDGRPFIGRKREVDALRSLAFSGKAEFIAVYGRRRVGKTFLIRRAFQEFGVSCFYAMGERGAPMQRQLAIFQKSFETSLYDGDRLARISSWHDAFDLLVAGVKRKQRSEPGKPIVIFIDELPWLHTRRSPLLSAIDHAWNTELQNIAELKLIICGSAASWMIRKVIHSKGGLYGRITKSFALKPFTLSECRRFLQARGYTVDLAGVVELYMIFGGIPFYLEQLETGLSPSQNISRLCFGDGALSGEYALLMRSLFDDAEHHMKILHALSQKQKGLTRTEIVKAARIPSGGRLDLWLEELERSDLIARVSGFRSRRREERYRIIDEFILFHYAWIRGAPSGLAASAFNGNYWNLMVRKQAYKIWCGYAFENLCMKHLPQINKALGITAVLSSACAWSHRTKPAGSVAEQKRPTKVPHAGNEAEQGAQIDMVIDRDDGTISLCEIKYRSEPFIIDEPYAREVERKIAIFKCATKTRKNLLFVLIAPCGVKRNEHSRRLVTNVVTLSDLFDE